MRLVVRFAPYSFAIAALLSSAYAQGAPPNTKAAERWDGYYTGANMGGAFGGGDMLSIIPSGVPFKEGEFYPGQPFDPAIKDAFRNLDVDFDASFTGGFQAGVLTSTAGIVYGVEADINLLNVDDSASVTVTSANPGGSTYRFRNEIDMDYVASLRARVGVPIDNFLIYGTAGLAVTTVNYSHEFDGTAVVATAPVAPNPAVAPFAISERASISKTTAGWTLGGGFEYLISPSWSLRTEYTYTNFGAVSSSGNKISPASGNGGAADAPCGIDTRRGAEFFDGATAGNAPTPRQCFNHEADVVLHSVRLGLNYKFNQNTSDNLSSPPSSMPGPASWTGFYVGGHGGTAENDGEVGAFRFGTTQSLVNSGTDYAADGWLYGGQAGYNYQLGQTLLGVEGTYSKLSDVGGEDHDRAFSTFKMDVDDVWTVAARGGLVWGRILAYAKAGYANGRTDFSGFTGSSPTLTFGTDKRLDGWVLGGGVDFMLSKNIVVGLEYTRIDLGDQRLRITNNVGGALSFDDVGTHLDTVSARLSYKFSGP